MTPLARLIAERIRETGPISIADYMAECLLHPVHGYYTTREPFGAAGDFTTAPEISQMFGELFGLALAQAWVDRGAPDPFILAEPGPGRGTLMADVLRATRGVPGFHAALRLVLVEASPRLRALQAERLADHRPQWVDRIEDLPEGPLFLIGNEFLDALPIRQFLRSPEGWRERLVGLIDGALAFGLSAPLPEVPDTPAFRHAAEGALVEDNLPARLAVAEVARRIARHGGLACWIDYGGWRSQGDTLQALRHHAFDDPLAHPGEADLTAHVDFEPLAALAPAWAYDTQGAVLRRLGIDARADRLAQGLTGARLDSHRAAHRRLTDPAEMGSLFKVLAVTSAGAPPPPGFA
ncbi:class I SAM-dependent methyltransferase [Tabrizicola flagellatus]|uniref:class I SAM-dependent methyltransferase n=1 Tax=Tabrizicola flagellatus TaxID=2593021 RepID=UPI0011F1185F|nr:SAM-dependent methyltransferase [Tabrizicola flagellatus]